MKIRRLKLSGFKSFVEPSELRIEPGLTGVVGPNGCGKSNLLEAIRWVMGEGSPKSLRGGGMEDVIFAGTAQRPPRDFAEVSILLDQEDGESEVTRRIERGAGSAYRVDGKDVRAKDVALLFADAATGAHSPALVSQGRIGAVIAAKPTERRLMLEEAAGISGLHARRKDAEQKLRAAEANLARLAELLSDQENRASTLRRQARAAERYRQLTEKIRAVEARLIHARWVEAEREARKAREEAAAAQAEVDRLLQHVERARGEQREAEAALAKLREATAEARSRGSEIAHQLATARARRDTVTRRLAELERLHGTTQAEIEREQALQADAAKAIGQLEAERSAIEARLADSEANSARLATDLSALEAKSREAEVALADMMARQAAMRAERRVAEAALEAARAQLGRIEAERAKLTDQRRAGDLRGQHEAAREEGRERASAAESARADAEARVAAAEEGRTAAVEARDVAESALASARAAQSAASAEHKALSSAVQGSGNSLLSALSVDPGFEQALAAALGDDADAALGNEGSRRWAGSEPQADDPPLADGLERLVDHVRAPAQLIRRLRQVGIADADTGQRLAVGQRLVTRDGMMRRWDGFVSASSGAANAERLVRVNRLAEISRQLPALEAAVGAAEAARNAAGAEIARIRAEGDSARAAAATAERELRDAQRAADAADAAIERIAAQQSAIEQRIEELAPVAKAAADAVAGAEGNLVALPDPDELEATVGNLRALAAEAGAAVADKRAEAATRARETAAARERHSAAGREDAEWRRRQKDAEKRVAESAERLERYRLERVELEAEPAVLESRIAELEHEASGSEAALSAALSAEREAERLVSEKASAVASGTEASASAREQRAGAEARAEAQNARRTEYARIALERFECVPQRLPEKLGFDADEVADPDVQSTTLERLTADRERIGPVNLVAEQELAEIEADRTKGAEEAEELTQAIHRLRGSIGSLNREGRVRLLDAFEKVNTHFQSLFTTLFEGGQAHLELVESDDPLEAGLEIMAQPPGKRLSTLTLLSGGEQALTAVALIFGLFLTNPAPICVLDEVDAPLDDANVERFCDLLERMTRETDTRYLIVTHNAVTMSRMHRLYGVTMIEKGISRLVSVDLGGAETLLAAE
ncbi:chromosome segregation protein SMC [Sphingomonas sinipercae]|uniref:Chromosome partition protein Smc n=1 Tax=Sphingomonas sinipercae TaxID=2714944 RepID=A0A6G7ZLJ0_9SPHN|nr:chromosome segregation protein SMC [Sphingomonas sinipercae]QIL01788.1 chromosome segregation protein SMC [Sphingomonas sinipercae]